MNVSADLRIDLGRGDVVRLLAVAGLYVAGVIGAGFASGQELTVFFVNYGWGGLVGVFVTTVFLTLGTILILEFCAERSIRSYEGLFADLSPFGVGVFDWIYTFFLLIGVSVMLAGIGAMGSTTIGHFLLRFGTACLILVVLRRGVEGVLTISGWLAPAIVVVLSVLAAYHIKAHPPTLPTKGSWRGIEAAALYASYNLGFSMAVFASTHRYLTTRRQRWTMALVGNLTLGLSMLLLYFGLNTLSILELEGPFPLLHLAANAGPIVVRAYRLMLWGAMYTTALAHTFALVGRVTNPGKLNWSSASALVIAVSLSLSFFGFQTLIRVAYPILGLAGLWLLANLLRLHWTGDRL